MELIKTEIGEEMNKLPGTFTGVAGRKVGLGIVNSESEQMQAAIVNLLPLLVRWLITYRAPGRFAAWVLKSHGLTPAGVTNHTVLVAYALLMAAKNR